jgi:hypothetical protein
MIPFEITNEAVKQVEENNKIYCEKLCAFAEVWVKTQMKPFTADDLKRAFYLSGSTPPSQPAVFGVPFRKLSKNKQIFDTERTKKSTNPDAHHRPLRVWISKEYRLKQQSNRKLENKTLELFN